MCEQKQFVPFKLSEYLGWRSEAYEGANMNFWEQLGLTIFQSVLAELHFNPAKVTTLSKILIPIRDTLISLYPLNITLVSPVTQAK
jgi:hypothetical protein